MDQNNYSWPLINNNITAQDKKALCDFIMNADRFTNGPKVKEFEKQWSNWQGVKHSVMVNSGAMANYISIAVLKELKGFKGEIIVPPIGWVSDIASVIHSGFTPVFVDVDKDTMSISADKIEEAITDETIGIVLVHCLGFNGLSEKLLDIVKKRNLVLIEDCCESHGALHNSKMVGSYGDMSCFSFFFGHHMTTIEGGMICTNNDEIFELAKLYRSHGMTRESNSDIQKSYSEKYPDLNPMFTFAVPGYNARNTEINAVLGIEQLARLNSNIEARKNNLDCWLSNLDSKKYYTDFLVEGNSNFSLPLILNDKSQNKFQLIQELLKKEGVEFRVGTAGGGNQALQPYLEKYPFKISGNLDNANHIHHFGLYVGNHPELNELQIKKLCNNLNKC
jgi:CDP-4-dehydro-6-deoxyglucose reductase, E1